MQAQTRLARAIRAEQDSVARMVNRLEWVRKQLQDLAGQLRGDSGVALDSSAQRLAVLADSLDRRAVQTNWRNAAGRLGRVIVTMGEHGTWQDESG